MMFAVVESNRYAYYAIKQQSLENSTIGRILGFIRYNSFIVFYPIGAIGENVVIYGAKQRIIDKQLYSIFMPNKFNFVFDMGFIFTIAPLLYLPTFPLIYYYLLLQRNKYFKEIKERDAAAKTNCKVE